MKKFIAPGEVVEFTAAADQVSGDVLVYGGLIGVVVNDVKNTFVGQLHVEGIHELVKTTSQTWAEGERIYWDVSAAKFTNVKDTDTHYAGVAAAAAASA